jgi:Rod binding domain-containing protein
MVNMLQGLAAATHPGRSQPSPKIRKAAQEFEAQLISALLAPLAKSFSTVPGEPSAAGSEEYGFLGGQALAASLSQAGGVGIADLLVKSLCSTKVLGAEPRAEISDSR